MQLQHASKQHPYLNQMLRKRIIFLLICTAFVIFFYWTLFEYGATESTQLFLGNITYIKKNHLKNGWEKNQFRDDLKYILLWSSYDYAPFYFFQLGQKSFIENKCSVINCYVTTNRNLFKGDLTKFHAIAINGRTMSGERLPKIRSPHQKYIYFNLESADNNPVCDKRFDGYFNWTATYKLNSDIPFPYIAIKNKEGKIIGPKINMVWAQNVSDVDENFTTKFINKNKIAAWFVSNCKSKNGRNYLVKKLQKYLQPYKLSVDVYGSCGPLNCFRNETERCDAMLENDYFFYMSLENTNAEDYVTEKLLTALNHYTVPVVFGGADYSRFLPPESYIDATKLNTDELAATMVQLMNNPEMYSRFFRWKSLYTYSNPTYVEDVCAVCAAINNKTKFGTVSVYTEFRKWWNPNYKFRCLN